MKLLSTVLAGLGVFLLGIGLGRTFITHEVPYEEPSLFKEPYYVPPDIDTRFLLSTTTQELFQRALLCSGDLACLHDYPLSTEALTDVRATCRVSCPRIPDELYNADGSVFRGDRNALGPLPASWK